MRHGEVDNPRGVLYGRLPGYPLSSAGRDMARAAAEWVQASGRDVTSLTCSPLERTQESAEPFTEVFGVAPRIDERVIEPTNVFEGRRMRIALMNPLNWRHLRKPALPSWGEPYAEVIVRMNQAMTDAWKQAEGGDAVIVSHQLPIWVTHLAAAGESSRHDPRQRRCALSSVTSFEMRDGLWTEIGYAEPAQTAGASDVGAV